MIREMTFDDKQAVLDLLGTGPDYCHFATLRMKMLHSGIRTYLLEENNTVLATASLWLEPKFIHDGSIVGHVEDVVVRGEDRHKGHGTALVKRLTEMAFLAGAYKVVLACREELVQWYERVGYRRHEVQMRIDRAADCQGGGT